MKNDKANKQGRKWFVFYAYVRPLLVVLFNIQTTVTLLNVFSELPFYGQVYSIGTILLIVFNMIIWFLALGESKKLIMLINYLLIYETIFIPMGSAMSENYSDAESILVYFILVAILALCWFWPNYIYFKKRKWIFQNEQDVTTCQNCNNKILKIEKKCPCCKSEININDNIKEKGKTMFICSNCKAKVRIDSKFCPKCGESFEDEEETIKEKKSSNKKSTSNNVPSDMDKKYSDLNKLKKLLDNDVITKEEFEREKKKVLNK